MTDGAILWETCRDMVRIGGRVEVGQVAAVTSRGRPFEDVALVAGAALRTCVGAGQREPRRSGMVELRALPLCRGVANCAVLRETGSHVAGVGCSVEAGEVAAFTGRGSSGIAPIHVTLGALGTGMRTAQGEAGLRMVEGGTLPLCRRVTNGAVSGEAGGGVIGIRGSRVVRQVTTFTGSRSSLEDIVLVALTALGIGVGTGERELRCGGVIELCALPLRGGVADGAIFGKACGHMVWIRCGREFGKVAALACGRGSSVAPTDMTLSACHIYVCSGERQFCIRVVKLCALPLRGGVTDTTVFGEAGGDVVRVRGGSIFCQVAAVTGGQRSLEYIVLVTLTAFERAM